MSTAQPTTHRLYKFTRFERFWHWSQAALIITMLFTGFEIHGYLGGFKFQQALLIHEYAAWMLITLWTFAIFWHFTTGAWKNYIPDLRPQSLLKVARYYAWGIFIGESHPYHPTPDRKHNPLQRLAYLWLKLMINPLIWVSGMLLLFFSYDWIRLSPLGLQLDWVALTHTAAAYMMLLFFILHVYLATTAHPPTAYIKSMITGWEDEPGPAGIDTH
ncbi:MAG: cytochrome b/b6 domain-containing protein [Pseudomonadota bacterium]